MRHRGFSLVEMSIALVGAGLLAGVVLTMTSASTRSGCYETTQAQLTTIKDSIQKYAQKNDRYPMPADRRLGVNDPKFGHEAAVSDITGDSVPATIYYGALPFQALGLPTSFAADCWDNKFTYVVTSDYTLAAKFKDHNILGAITINSSDYNTLLANAAYAVISHGEDGSGAVKRNYTGPTPQWCVGNASAPLDYRNCQTGGTPLVTSALQDGKTTGAAHYDDLIIYNGRPEVLSCTITAPVTWSGGNCSAAVAVPPLVIGNLETVTVASTSTTHSGSVTLSCKNGVVTQSAATCVPTIPASCGAADWSCSSGYYTNGLNTSCGGKTWSCIGSGGASASCSTPCGAAVHGACGATDWSCSSGYYTNGINTSCGGKTWNCAGTNNGTTANCSAPCPAPVNAVCGGGDWSCDSGYYSGGAYTACGGKTWQCLSSTGGATANCSTACIPGFVNGTCHPYGCTTLGMCGNVQSGGQSTTPCATGTFGGGTLGGGNTRWTCVGSNGGSTASCSASVGHH
ncbi:MAG: hypothetical protein V4735_04850 [Pseudomonadota bacterium]